MAASAFWANRIKQVPQERPEPVQAPANGPWWAPVVPDQQPAQAPQAYAQPEQVQIPAKAVSARSTAVCPGCASGNYFAVPGAGSRCYDCGFPVVQQFSGAGMPSAPGDTATATRQLPPDGYNPGQFVGHIG